jgi:hypothetical protein
MSAASPVTLSDHALVRLSKAAVDKRKTGRTELLGVHRGINVLAEYICSDLCPAYTVRIIHYDLRTGPECTARGGMVVQRMVPVGIAVAGRPYCVPQVLARQEKSDRG